MADRRADDQPLAPRRPLSPAGRGDTASEARRPLSERVSAAVSAAGNKVQQASSSSGESRQGSAPSRSRSGAPTPRPRGTRRARLRLVHLDPWSVMKTSFLLSIAFAVVTVVSVAMVWQVLGAAGVWDSINSTIQELIPARVRGWTDLVINGSFWVGAALASGASILLLDPRVIDPEYGWRIAFFGGALIGPPVAPSSVTITVAKPAMLPSGSSHASGVVRVSTSGGGADIAPS